MTAGTSPSTPRRFAREFAFYLRQFALSAESAEVAALSEIVSAESPTVAAAVNKASADTTIVHPERLLVGAGLLRLSAVLAKVSATSKQDTLVGCA